MSLVFSLTNRTCNEVSILSMVKLTLNWVCIVLESGRDASDADAKLDWILLGCEDGSVSHRCRIDQNLVNSVCSNQSATNSSNRCLHVLMLSNLSAVCSNHPYKIDVCQNTENSDRGEYHLIDQIPM